MTRSRWRVSYRAGTGARGGRIPAAAAAARATMSVGSTMSPLAISESKSAIPSRTDRTFSAGSLRSRCPPAAARVQTKICAGHAARPGFTKKVCSGRRSAGINPNSSSSSSRSLLGCLACFSRATWQVVDPPVDRVAILPGEDYVGTVDHERRNSNGMLSSTS